MTTTLIYGKDSVGKSAQVKAICEASETPIVISLEMKNRKLYGLDSMGKMTEDTPFEVVEPLVLEAPPSFKTMPVETFNAMGKVIERILNGQGPDGKKKLYTTVVIDGISDFPRWTEQVVIREIQKKHADQKVIGKENLAGWAARNNLACMPVERLAAWAEVAGANVFLTTLMSPEYINNAKQGYKVDIQDRIRDKSCDVRIGLMKDGRGFIARFEKLPSWATKTPEWEKKGVEEVAVADGGLFAELSKRGLL
jgi:hypothetical protein